MSDTTTVLSATDLQALLAVDGIDATDISKIIGNHTNIVVETTTANAVYSNPTPDSAGQDPSLLVVTNSGTVNGIGGDTIDTTNFVGLKNVVLPDSVPVSGDGGYIGT